MNKQICQALATEFFLGARGRDIDSSTPVSNIRNMLNWIKTDLKLTMSPEDISSLTVILKDKGQPPINLWSGYMSRLDDLSTLIFTWAKRNVNSDPSSLLYDSFVNGVESNVIDIKKAKDPAATDARQYSVQDILDTAKTYIDNGTITPNKIVITMVDDTDGMYKNLPLMGGVDVMQAASIHSVTSQFYSGMLLGIMPNEFGNK